MRHPKIRHFIFANTGSIGPMFALVATVVLGAVGVAVDYSRNNNNRANLQAAADAAALAGVASAVEVMTAGGSVATATAASQAQTLKHWQAEIADVGDAVTSAPVITLNQSGGVWTVKLDYAASMQTSLLSVLGFSDLQLAGTATATNSLVSSAVNNTDYYDFTFLADISASMGIGATHPIRQAMIAHPKISCDFACHQTVTRVSSPPQPPYNPYLEARAAGFTLRIDEVDEAIEDAIDKLQDLPSPSRFRAALYGMDKELVTYQVMTSNLSAIKSETVDIRPVTGGKGYTWGKKVLQDIKPKIGTSGDGSTQAKAKKILVLISDGVENFSHPVSGYHNTAGYSHWTNAISVERCDEIKASGVTILTLQVDFIQEYGPANYAATVQPIEHLIEPKMQACATSPSHYRSVDDASDIAAALDDLVDEIFSTSSTGVARLIH